jgi:hypothetical protein
LSNITPKSEVVGEVIEQFKCYVQRFFIILQNYSRIVHVLTYQLFRIIYLYSLYIWVILECCTEKFQA